MERIPSVPDQPQGDTRAETDVGLYYVFIEQVLQSGAIGAASQFLADEFIEHGMAGDRSRDDFIAHLVARRARFPNAAWTIEALAAVGGLVVCYMTMVTPDLPAQLWESVVIRFEHERIAECWTICDRMLLVS
jgi:predicted SnoaL-like aldol condensation-catalyzing enzyme